MKAGTVIDLTGPAPAVIVKTEMSVQESQAIERALRCTYDPKRTDADFLNTLIAQYERVNERAEATSVDPADYPSEY